MPGKGEGQPTNLQKLAQTVLKVLFGDMTPICSNSKKKDG